MVLPIEKGIERDREGGEKERLSLFRTDVLLAAKTEEASVGTSFSINRGINLISATIQLHQQRQQRQCTVRYSFSLLLLI